MKQTHDGATVPRSRRSLLTAAGAATAAMARARPLPASAAPGDPLILGQENFSNVHTGLQGASFATVPSLNVNNDVGVGDPNFNTIAISAFSDQGMAVVGESQGNLVLSSSGVRGVAGKRGGVGVSALKDEGGLALHVASKARLATRSGRATVSAGRPSVDIDLRSKGGLSGAPMCFANLILASRWFPDGRPGQAPARDGS